MKYFIPVILLVFSSDLFCSEYPGHDEFVLYEKNKATDFDKAYPLLLKSAEKGFPAACAIVGGWVDGENFPFEKFGSTKKEAQIRLLQFAAKSEKVEDYWLLGRELLKSPQKEDQEEGEDFLKQAARGYFQHAWWDYSNYVISKKNHSVVDLKNGYFFLVAFCLNIHPESPRGKEAWEVRDRITRSLRMSELEAIHQDVDRWLSNVKLGTNSTIADVGKETRAMIIRVEKDFRSNLQKREEAKTPD